MLTIYNDGNYHFPPGWEKFSIPAEGVPRGVGMEQDVKIASGHGFLLWFLICKKSEQFYRAKISTLGKFSRSCEIPTPRGDASRDRKIYQ